MQKYNGKRKLSPRQEAAAVTLAIGGTKAQAARSAGVSVPGVQKWLQNIPEFKRSIVRYREEATSRTLGIACECSVEAILKLVQLMRESPNEKTQLRAAESILMRHERLTELVALSERVSALEDRQQSNVRAKIA